MVEILRKALVMYRKTAIKPGNKESDQKGDPKLFKFVWTNWLDFVKSKELKLEKDTWKLPKNFNDQYVLGRLKGIWHSTV